MDGTLPLKMAGTFFLVDGTALAYRSHFAFINNPLTNSKGQQTSATFGYVRGLLQILREVHVLPSVFAFPGWTVIACCGFTTSVCSSSLIPSPGICSNFLSSSVASRLHKRFADDPPQQEQHA